MGKFLRIRVRSGSGYDPERYPKRVTLTAVLIGSLELADTPFGGSQQEQHEKEPLQVDELAGVFGALHTVGGRTIGEPAAQLIELSE